jgi:hypothetical protein
MSSHYTQNVPKGALSGTYPSSNLIDASGKPSDSKAILGNPFAQSHAYVLNSTQDSTQNSLHNVPGVSAYGLFSEMGCQSQSSVREKAHLATYPRN